MASFERMCRLCFGEGPHGCPGCGGTGRVLRPVTVMVQIAIDNREAKPFRMTIDEFGKITFTQAGYRKGISTTAQSAFNRARLEAAQLGKVKMARRTIRRGLIATGRGSR